MYALLTTLPGIPAGILLGYRIVPDESLPLPLRILIQGFGIFMSYPLFITGILFLKKSISQAMMLISSGVVFRMMGLMIVAVLLMLSFKAFFKEGMVIYFISIATFLIFELVSVVGLYIYAFKR